jgi:hypothetical protein
VLKNRASRRDPALCGYCKCSHLPEYAALSNMPHALADGLVLVFQHPAMWLRNETPPAKAAFHFGQSILNWKITQT